MKQLERLQQYSTLGGKPTNQTETLITQRNFVIDASPWSLKAGQFVLNVRC